VTFDADQRLVELAAGVYVESDVLDIVQRIRDYDPNIRVKYLDPDRGGDLGDPPYKIMELCPDGHERLIFGVWSLDERVMVRLFAADTQRHDILARLDGVNGVARADEARRYEQEREEMIEKAVAVLRSPKDTYTLPGARPGETIVMSATMPCKVRTKSGLRVPDAAE
jgi:hypothetical protein